MHTAGDGRLTTGLLHEAVDVYAQSGIVRRLSVDEDDGDW